LQFFCYEAIDSNQPYAYDNHSLQTGVSLKEWDVHSWERSFITLIVKNARM